MRRQITMSWILRKLDAINFLGFKIWDFSIRSFTRTYGWFFILKIALRHPVKTIRGLFKYRFFFQNSNFSIWEDIISNISSNDFIKKASVSPKNTLVAMSYCQRPLKLPEQPYQCPSIRFSHDCRYFNTEKISPACLACDIKNIVDRVKKIGCNFNLMTSALDIAKDIFIPTLKDRKFRQVIIFICPYSSRPIILPLLICGIDFILIPFASGSCKNYRQFSMADAGMKNQRTFVKSSHFELVKKILDQIGEG